MKKHVLLGALLLTAALSAGLTGCSSSGTKESGSPKVEISEIRDDVVEPDFSGADIEVYALNAPIDFDYSSSDTDMIFKKKDGVWLDAMDSAIPLNQEKFEAMAQNFLNLHAISEIDSADTASDYKKQLERLLEKKAHMLSEKEEAILAAASEISGTPSSVFALFNNADLKFEPVKDENGELVDVTHARYGKLIESRDRDVREAAFHSLYASYRQFANTVAANYEGNVKQGNFYARMRKYPSARAMYLAGNEIPEKVYDNLIESVHNALPLMHRYMKF